MFAFVGSISVDFSNYSIAASRLPKAIKDMPKMNKILPFKSNASIFFASNSRTLSHYSIASSYYSN